MAHYQKQKLSFNMHLQLTIIVDCKYVYSPRVYDTYTYTYLAKNIYFVRPSKWNWIFFTFFNMYM
jgi:hypothetical protein